MSYLVNPYMVIPTADYPDGIGSGGDGTVTWDGSLSPLRETESAGSNLPTYSWEWTHTYDPSITTALTANLGNQFSYSAWIKFNHLADWWSLMCAKGYDTATEEFISYNASSADGYAISGEAIPSKQMNSFYGTAQGLALDVWYHITYTVDGTGTGQYYTYVHGGTATGQYDANTGGLSATSSTDALTVGATRMSIDEPGNHNYFGGHMQQFLVHNRVLTSSEVDLLYGSGNGIELPATGTTLQDGLLVYFDFQQENTGASGTFTITNQAIP